MAVSVLLAAVVVALSTTVARGMDAALATECSADFQKVMGCMSYAKGEALAPTKECCASVTEMRKSSPKCMCFLIQQSRNGSEEIKQFGIKTDKLLQLPSACHLKNTSVTECPKLLGLAANSPAAAIFTNSTSPSAPTTSSSSKATPTSTALPDQTSGSDNLVPRFTAVGLVVFFTALTSLTNYQLIQLG